MLAIPISAASGKLHLGLALKRWGLLLTPEETSPPPIATRANALMRDYVAYGFDDANAIHVLHADARFRAQHEAMLPPGRAPQARRHRPRPRRRQAKLTDAETIEDLSDWLHPKETMVVLHDRALLNMLGGLPTRAELFEQTKAAE